MTPRTHGAFGIFSGMMLVCLCCSCAHVHSFHQEPLPAQKGQSVSVEATKTVWFHFDADTSWTRTAREQILAQCPTGTLTGMSSRLSTVNSFLHWSYHLRLTGECVGTTR